MKIRHFATLMLMAGSLALAGCGDSGGTQAETFVDEMNRIADAVEQVNSEEDARGVAHLIADAQKNMEEASKSLEGMSEAKKAMALAAHAQDMQKAQMRLATAMSKLATRDQDALRIISDEMGKMPRLD
ncbi:MAG: hypothetical protein CVT81_02090 [Alphaproteobacteria bacterium HGW-Alphaproteobacteria-3]|nr:MAG: hypothetical protein CVT81_02090 [Alphaproteobacteria bacterium HGW-Alphaproteobacteria-3]